MSENRENSMESPSNPNLNRDGLDEENRRSRSGSSSCGFRNLSDVVPDVAAQCDLEGKQMSHPERGQRKRQRAGISSEDSSEQNHSVSNQRVAEPGTEPPGLPAHASSEDSHSRGENIPKITAAKEKTPAQKARKKEVDRNYRQERQRKAKLSETLEPENKKLHSENESLKARVAELTKRLAEVEKEKRELHDVRESEKKPLEEKIKQQDSELKETRDQLQSITAKHIKLLEDEFHRSKTPVKPVQSKLSSGQPGPSSGGGTGFSEISDSMTPDAGNQG